MRSERRFRGFNSHPKLEGSHAFLSPSSYHWLNYPPEKLVERLKTVRAAALGSRIHAWAAEAIELGRMQPEDGDIVCAYINDAIRLGLKPEQTLFYSLNCYGTADAIGFEPYPDGSQYAGFLRINDLKTGVTKASVEQLYVYAGIFCHEYEILPYDIEGELTIYQGDEASVFVIDRNHLAWVYDQIRDSDQTIEEERYGGYV